MTMVTTDDG